MLALQPCSFAQASAFVARYHRHHRPPQGHKFSLAAHDGVRVVGVVMVGRPVNRVLDDGRTLEVTRCCVVEGVPNAASYLYGAAKRAIFALGYTRAVTYTLAQEAGTSLKANGWIPDHAVIGHSWNMPGRPRMDKHPTSDKWCWISERVPSIPAVPWDCPDDAALRQLRFSEEGW